MGIGSWESREQRGSAGCAGDCPFVAHAVGHAWDLGTPVHLWSTLNELRGLSSGSLGILSPGAACCMDGFAIQKTSVDTNLSSATRTLSLHLFPLVKSDVLLIGLCCGEAAEHSEGMSELNLI